MSDIVRVIRIIEYVGPRELVEKNVERSIHGSKEPGNGVKITVVTLGEYAEIIERVDHPKPTEEQDHAEAKQS